MPQRFFRVACFAVSLVITAAAVGGCASVPMASDADDLRMKRMAPPPDQGLVYLFRDEAMGYSVHMDVAMDGRAAGQTVAHSYMVWLVSPGRHTLTSSAENDTLLPIDVRPGSRTFVWQEVKAGLMYARSDLRLVSEQRGMSGVNACKLVKMPLPHPQPAPRTTSPAAPAATPAASPPSPTPPPTTPPSPTS